jgi:hypothetical protein
MEFRFPNLSAKEYWVSGREVGRTRLRRKLVSDASKTLAGGLYPYGLARLWSTES